MTHFDPLSSECNILLRVARALRQAQELPAKVDRRAAADRGGGVVVELE
jgi:hypothetical protein